MNRVLLSVGAAVVLAVSTGCATAVKPPTVTGEIDETAALAAWSRVLKRHVDPSGRIDFAGLAKNRADLDRFVAYVARQSPASAPSSYPTASDRIAYYLNSYNALAMYNLLGYGVPESLGLLKRIRFFKFRELEVGGRPISLYDYENDVIRKAGEERVHFALNCMVRGCPRLPDRPFLAADLDRQLDFQARQFLNEERNVRVDASKRKVLLSSILKFYTEDFLAKAPSLLAYVNRYRAVKVPEDFEVDFIPYDWTINSQPTSTPLP